MADLTPKQLVEHLIVLRDTGGLSREDRDLLAEACNTISALNYKQATTVRVHIRDCEIVGTPFGPEIPDGKYIWFAELDSKPKTSKEGAD